MARGLWLLLLLVAACTAELSTAARLLKFDFSHHFKNESLIAGFVTDFTCKVKDSETALLTIGGKTIAEAKGEAWEHVMMTHEHNGEPASCIAKDSSGHVVNEKKVNLSVWFPPILTGPTRHHYKLAPGHKEHVTIHFLTNPPIHKHPGQVRVIGPQGNAVKHFEVFHVIHNPHKTANHFFLLPFHEVKENDFGNYTLTIRSDNFPNNPMVFHFAISDLFASEAPTSLGGGVIAAIIIGVILTVGLLFIMIYLIHRAGKMKPRRDDHRPIVREEVGPSVEDGLVDDVFTDSRPGRSHINSIGDSVM